ncbi:beta-xylosidase [Friedmanniella endophytica]|uniref:Beta-xylosidase n=1 Tax=Microlunatus kandeliicorticis TaxID=1759536 RepID=A0A7W3P582_9ACTN|nr:family 43 glycosylhydrolase [Microlunatus kandeliicorticis]MBA8793678.1 beta-xylosidase [Microlunatus kandeliicorticis]
MAAGQWAGPLPRASATPRTINSAYAADPGFNRFGSSYYVYATGKGAKDVFPVFRGSAAVGGYSKIGHAFASKPSGLSAFWAPHVIQRGSSYFMFFTASRGGAKHCLYYATSTRPTGGFSLTHELYCVRNGDGSKSTRWEAIDPSTYETVEGNTYLVWRNGWVKSFPTGDYRIVSQRLTFSGRSVRFTTSTRHTLASVSNGPVMEAPDVIRHDRKLYLFVSRGRFDTNDYHTDVLVGSTIGSRFSFLNHLMATSSTFGYGPGGAEVVGKPANKVYIAYHVWQRSKPTPASDGGNRVTRTAEVVWVKGKPRVR